jgi:glycosyltransferase involved in cell wall biosynthesis
MAVETKNTPTISVVIPIFNVEPYLAECLDSIETQTFSNFEVILVDDVSTDDSMDIANNYAQRDDRFHIVHHIRNRGLAAARNTGVSASKGEYIAFVDSDDWIAKDYLESLLDDVKRHDTDISACGRYFAYDDRIRDVRLERDDAPLFSGRRLTREEALRAMNSYRSFDMSMWGKLFRLSLFDGIEFPEGKLSEDFFVCYKLIWRTKGVYYNDSPLYYYRRRTGSITTGSRLNTDYLAASDLQLEFMEKNCPGLRWVGVSAGVVARISLANACAQRGIHLEDAVEMQRFVRQGFGDVIRNPDLAWMKKFQVACFAVSPRLYMRIFTRLKRG